MLNDWEINECKTDHSVRSGSWGEKPDMEEKERNERIATEIRMIIRTSSVGKKGFRIQIISQDLPIA